MLDELAPEDRLAPIDQPVLPVALMISVDRSRYGSTSVKNRPVTLGKSGRWVVSRLTWKKLLERSPDDPHDDEHLTVPRRLGSALFSADTYGAVRVSDDPSLSLATPAVWERLREVVDAGIEVVPAIGTRQPVQITLTDGFGTQSHVRPDSDGARVDVEVTLDGRVVPLDVTYPQGRPRITGFAAVVVDQVLHLGPVPTLSLTESRLLNSGESLHIGSTDLDEFSASLTRIGDTRTVRIDDGAIVPSVITGPVAVLTIEIDDDRSSRLEWRVEYTVDDEPRLFGVGDDPGAAPFRDVDAEDVLWEDQVAADPEVVAITAFPVWQETACNLLRNMFSNPMYRPEITALIGEWQRIFQSEDDVQTVVDTPTMFLRIPLELPPIGTAFVCEMAVPEIEKHGAAQIRITGDSSFREAREAPVLTFSQADSDEDNDWFDLSITLDVDGTQVPLAALIQALALDEQFMVLPDGTYFALDVPGLDELRTLLEEARADATIVVTSYTLLRIDYDSYADTEWAGAIFDEGQFLKNHQSQVHQAARRLPAPFKLAITGTPMENRVMELWSLVSITAPGLYSSPKDFKKHFAAPIERGQAPERLKLLRRRLKPIMLRRTKDQVLDDLPPKQEQVLELTLEPAHRKIYDTFLARERQQLLGLLDDFENNRIRVLRALTLLRQLSLHPGLVDDEHADVKSAKITHLAEQLPVLVAEGHSALVFSSFTGFLRKLADRLEHDGIAHSYLDGSTPANTRARQIDDFTSGETGVFLISLKAGGFGLNLTNADYCFMADPWWNPAAENQAIDRTHRIGQRRPVTVYRLVSEGTIEEKVIDLQNRKRELFSALIDDGAQFSGAITADDVRALLS